MALSWTPIQLQRLTALGAEQKELDRVFDDPKDRNRTYQTLERRLTGESRQKLAAFRDHIRRPVLSRLERDLSEALIEDGFSQVTTPILMSKGLLAKMGVTPDHPLNSQVFWVDKNRCLRPMLAPHLYYVLKDLLRLWDHPVRIFEIGPCFRKESEGAKHSEEFTMLNLVEMGQNTADWKSRLEDMAKLVTRAAGIEDWRLNREDSEVYGYTLDVEAGPEGVEVGSGAIGPHFLDGAWGIDAGWAGIGFGLERLAMVREKDVNLSRWGRSLSYLNGIRLNV